MANKSKHILQKGDMINDTYSVQCFIGKGAFGEVYRVKHKFMGAQVIKLLDDDYVANTDLESVTKEARILSELTHKNIVRVFEANSFELLGKTRYFITMGFVSGESLAQLMQREISLAVDVSLSIQIAMLQGLNEVHQKNPPIIHRDISPDNILLSYDEATPRALLSDFGLAQSVDQMSGIAGAAGKYLYFAPECFWGVYLPASDVFSAGIVLYRMLTGSFPWNFEFDMLETGDREAVSTMIMKGRKVDPTPPSFFNDFCSPNLDRITLKAINKDLDVRYSNAKLFLDELLDENNINSTGPVDSDPVKFLYY
jgi:serine/threonine-protein kinase